MLTGAHVVAPEGFGELAKQVTYHFVTNVGQMVLLARFDSPSTKRRLPKVSLLRLQRGDLEDGINRKLIHVSPSDTGDLPPWLSELKDVNIASLDMHRTSAKRSHREYVETRLFHIMPALEDIDAIWADEDIEGAINRYANSATPKQNTSRYRLWLLTYLCFGRNLWALLPPFHKLGTSERRVSTTKLGAPSKAFGKHHGHAKTPQMEELCLKGYLKFSAPGESFGFIYSKTLVEIFGCKTTKRPDGTLSHVHPEGKPFPSYRQFYYCVTKAFGPGSIRKNRVGSARHRSSLAPSKGRFSQQVANVLEVVEFDGYYTKELPKGYIDGKTLPPLCVVTAREDLSGMKVGIGFSFNESAAAYRMALFCMAVPKKYFCELFGIQLGDDQWISEGFPPHMKHDRGAGSSPTLIQNEPAKPVIRNMVPSWSPQSKATVESSHPKDVKLQGRPTHVLSELTPVELAKREIIRLIAYNESADMSARMEIDPDLAEILPTPQRIYKHYNGILRNSGVSMSISEAVRSFLTPVEVFAKADGVYLLDERRFDCPELRETGLLDKIARNSLGKVALQGYILDLCLRHIWVEIDNTIIRLDAVLTVRDTGGLLLISIRDLASWKERRGVADSKFSEHKRAVVSESLEKFEASTGKKLTSGRRKGGAAKTNKLETQEARSHMSKRGRT